jgi:predicted kinase
MTDLEARKAKYKEALDHWRLVNLGMNIVLSASYDRGIDRKTFDKAHRHLFDAEMLLCPWVLKGKEYFGEDFMEWCNDIK